MIVLLKKYYTYTANNNEKWKPWNCSKSKKDYLGGFEGKKQKGAMK